MVTESSFRRRTRQWRASVAAIILAGAALSLGAYTLANRVVARNAFAQFERLSMEPMFDLERSLWTDVNVLLSVRALYVASESVEPDEFQSFAAITMEQFPHLQALAWAPVLRDRTGGTASTVPVVTYVTPAATSVLRPGLDLHADVGWRRALDAARDKETIVLTHGPDAAGDGQGLMAVIAIYRNGVPHRTVAERRAALAGFAVALLRKASIGDDGRRGMSPNAIGIDLAVYDHSVDSGTRLLVGHRTRPYARTDGAAGLNLRSRTRFEVGERRFAIVATPGADFFTLHPSASSLAILLLGLLATAVAGAYFAERQRVAEAREQKLRVSAALTRVGRELMGVIDTHAVLGRLAELTVRALECDESYTWIHDDRDDSYTPVAGYGFPERLRTHLKDARVPRRAWASVIQDLETQPVVQVTQEHSDSMIRAVIARFGTNAVLCVPLRRGGDLIGLQTAAYRDGTSTFTAAQQQIALGIAQLASLALANAHMIEDLAEAGRLKSEFVSTVSHELRTPLNVIFGYTECLRDPDFGPDDRTEFLDKIEQHGRQLLELIDNTLQIGDFERGVETVRVQEIALGDLWDSIATECASYPHPAEVTLQWASAPEVALRTDPQKIRTVLRNLVHNALKFTANGAVRVAASVDRDEVVFRVADTGVGIRPEAQEAIFELFRQGDGSETRRYGGTGVGLYVVRKVVEQLHGRVIVQSRTGEGSVFTVRLPRTVDPSGTSRAA